ncbi:MAG TPA: hypothetical protein VFG28_13135 [Syntrophales bacterium]|nr:hypothetical protein [Syntrophales bacterium]
MGAVAQPSVPVVHQQEEVLVRVAAGNGVCEDGVELHGELLRQIAFLIQADILSRLVLVFALRGRVVSQEPLSPVCDHFDGIVVPSLWAVECPLAGEFAHVRIAEIVEEDDLVAELSGSDGSFFDFHRRWNGFQIPANPFCPGTI